MSQRPPGPTSPDEPLRLTWRFDVSDAVNVPGAFASAATLIAPPSLDPNQSVTLLVCLPGGFLSRAYFDLQLAPLAQREQDHATATNAERTYSFAAAMAARGFVVLTIDHIGTGDSTQPEPVELGYDIGIDAIARANDLALRAARERLAAGDASAGLPPVFIERSIGIGHSMGSMLTVEQQAFAPTHEALVLFSFSTQGIPRFMDDDMRGYANDPARLRREIGILARVAMGSPYPERATNSEDDRRAAFGVGTAPNEAEEALQLASTNLLAVGGLTSMVPAGFSESAVKIDVPVFMIVGDHDLHDDRHTRRELPNAPKVTTYILEDCWHCHFVANTRETLWQVVSDWIQKESSVGL